MPSVLVGVERSDASRAACVTGSWLADRLDLGLVLVHVGHKSPSPYGDHAHEARMQHAATRRAMATLQAVGPERAKRRTATGRPAEVLQSLAGAEDAELIVVGSQDSGGLRATLSRSVVEALTARSECPLVVVPPSAFKRVLRLEAEDARAGVICGLEGSVRGDAAVAAAIQVAERAQLELTFVHATTAPGSPAAVPGAGIAVPVEPAVSASARVAAGTPADVLRRVAKEQDAALIVVGTRNRGRFARILLGSVSASLMASAPCPVMVVPSGAALRPSA
jgi:nucleotide-binding universal stress UspA family protein